MLNVYTPSRTIFTRNLKVLEAKQKSEQLRMEQMEAEHRRRQQEHQDAVDDEYEETLAKYVSDSFLLPPFPSTPFYMRMNETHLPLSEIK